MFLKPESNNHLEVSKPPKNFRRFDMKKKSTALLNLYSYHNKKRSISEHWKDKSSKLNGCFNPSHGERAKKK